MKWLTRRDKATALETIEMHDLNDNQVELFLEKMEYAAKHTPWHSHWAYVAAHRIATLIGKTK
jgi:hypothetical protein